jgi:hypothetical protein
MANHKSAEKRILEHRIKTSYGIKALKKIQTLTHINSKRKTIF